MKTIKAVEYEERFGTVASCEESDVIKKAIALLGVKKGDGILDAGCGSGNLLREIERSGVNAKLYGIDYLPGNIKIAEERLKKTKLAVGDVTKLPYSKNSFNKIALLGVIVYLSEKDLERCAAEISRVSKKRAIVVVRNNQPWNRIGNRLLSAARGKQHRFVDSYHRPSDVIKAFEGNGFKLKRFEISIEKKINAMPIIRTLLGSAWYVFEKK